MEFRDPIHGAIELDPLETALVRDPWIQRLRTVGQMGFSPVAFPGATHSRFMHSLGVLHLAGVAFDRAYRDWKFEHPESRSVLRRCVRAAALCHDLGHPPYSHSMEFAMPAVSALGLRWGGASRSGRRATHEDYTLAILEHTSLGRCIDEGAPFSAKHVAALINAEVDVTDDLFVDGGCDHRRLLSQIISSELDVDRLDYLPRDAFFSGARYGQVDTGWLISNLVAWPDGDQATLGLEGRAVYAFDHFLLARHHMFLMVYFHHKSVVYDELLKRHVESVGASAVLPADLDAYLRYDDVWVGARLREHRGEWAQRIATHAPYARLLERHSSLGGVDVDAATQVLRASGVDVIAAASRGRLSKTVMGQKRRNAPEICVLERTQGLPIERVRPLSESSQVFVRYADERVIERLYVAPEQEKEAKALLIEKRLFEPSCET